MRRARSQPGQATVEFVVLYGALVLPLTFALLFTAELLWVWHSVVEFTRAGARYAATHCWQASGENVITYMRDHVPPMVDQEQFRGGPAEIVVEYFARDPETGQLTEFTCESGECSTQCVPDAVTVRVQNYEFRRFVTFLGLAPVALPDFHTSVPVESAGCTADEGTCTP